MDSPSGPSIMGSENTKFSERSLGRSDSDASDAANMADVSSQNMSSRKSKDGLTRDERIKLVRERQLLVHKRRLDELKQAQMTAFKAKQQQEEQKRRYLEELRNRDEQRRNEVLARKRKLEEIERNRKEAILKKHQEIFDRIDNKRRQHESRRMAYGLSTYRLSEQDDTMFSNDMSASRRAVSVGALTSRNRGSLTQRSHHHSVVLSPNSSQSARIRGSPGTPSRTGGPLDYAPGSKAGSAENSPAHSTRPPRSAQSHPPPIHRHRPAETARSRQGSRPQTAQAEPASARAKRPTSLMTRSLLQPAEGSKTAANTPDTSSSFRTLTKRSQSVGNVSARTRRKKNEENTTLQPARSEVEIEIESPRRNEEIVRFESSPKLPSTPENPELSTRSGRKVISEGEAKAALAEKRRLARLKLEAEKNAAAGFNLNESIPIDSQPSSSGFEAPEKSLDRRASVAEFVELEKSFIEESGSLSQNGSVADKLNELNKASEQEPEEESFGTGVLVSRQEEDQRDNLREEENVVVVESQNLEMEEAIENLREGVEEIVHLLEEIPENIYRQVESPLADFGSSEYRNDERPVSENRGNNQPMTENIPIEIPYPLPVEAESFVRLQEPESSPPPTTDPAIDEFRRRKLEEEQREDEERSARRQRLEAIKRMTKSGSTLNGSTDRLSTLASPVTETAKPIDALENARKLLQRRGMGGGSVDSPSMTPSQSNSGLKNFADVIEEPRSLSGTPLSDVSSTDTVSLSGFVRTDGVFKGQNGFEENVNPFNGSSSAMSNNSSVDFDPFRSNGEWNGVAENGVEGSHYWNGSAMNGSHAGAGVRASNSDNMLLNFDTS